MANIISNMINRLRLPDDDYDEDTYLMEEEAERQQREQNRLEREQRKREKEAAKAANRARLEYNADDENDYDDDDSSSRRRWNTRNQGSSNVMSFGQARQRSMTVVEVNVEKPESFDDAQDIADKLLNGVIIILNIEGLDLAAGQRIIDYLFGCMHAINGTYRQASRSIFVMAPSGTSLEGGEFDEIMEENGFDVPVINKDF